VKTLRQQFEAAGGRLSANGDALKIQAPHPLPPELLERIRERRDRLTEVYNERAAIREHDGGLARADAEREAATDALAVLDEPDAIKPHPTPAGHTRERGAQ